MEQFFEELRRSRSRTISLALVRPASPAAAAAAGVTEQAVAAAATGGGMAEFVAAHRTRTGLATPQASLEAYLVTRGPLASRLIKTARMVCPPHQVRGLLACLANCLRGPSRDWRVPGPFASVSADVCSSHATLPPPPQ